ncbi:MAG: hypothetical protein TU36_005865 [Vulcanisaeta sp. AZ3]
MGSRDRFVLDSVMGLSDGLLIIVPPFIDSLLSSMAILHERFRRGLATHLTLLTLAQLEYLNDTISNYNAILLVDPPNVLRLEGIGEIFSSKRIFVISRGNVKWLSADSHLEYDGSLPQLIWQFLGNELDKESMRFLEAAVVYESSSSNYDASSFSGWLNAEPTSYIALPGILRLPLSAVISRAFSPAIPGLTGNEAEAKDLVKAVGRRLDVTYTDLTEDQVMDLLRYLGDFMLRAGFRGEYLDKLVFTNRKWLGLNVDVLDSLLALEAQLALWEYAGGIVDPILNPQSVEVANNVIIKYISILSNYLNQLSKVGITLNNQQLTLADRLCSILSFSFEKHDETFSTPDASLQISCVFSGNVKEADIIFNRSDYSITVRGLPNEDQR